MHARDSPKGTQLSPFVQNSTMQKHSAQAANPSMASAISNLAQSGNEDWLIPAIEDAGLDYVDKRDTGGNLWVIGDRKIAKIIDKFQKRGAHFRYRESGGKATKGRSAWWVK